MGDAALGGRPTVIRLTVRRFFCDVAECGKRTFAEQIPGLTMERVRSTALLRSQLTSIALSVAGRAGARLTGTLGIPTSRNTLLRLVAALPDPAVGVVKVLGVDDFAFRRGRTYGTVLINLDTHRPIDLLPDREAGTLAAWLAEHPGVEVICRDRASAYAQGARSGAPAAIQVADRWHLWHNLAGYVEKTINHHRNCLREQPVPSNIPEPVVGLAQDLDERAAAARSERFERRVFVQHARERFAAVQELKAEGLGIKPIMRELGLAKETVRKYYRAASADDILAKTHDGRGKVLEPFKPYLNERFNAGTTNATALFREITEHGYRGSLATVNSYLRPFRPVGAAPAATPLPPKVRDITRWILTHPDHLDDQEAIRLKGVLSRCPELEATARHVAAFAEMLTELGGEHLNEWIAAVQTDDLPHLKPFTAGIDADHAAVLNGLTLPHSSGAVEGHVNRIKMLKRQMYGRAGFALLRKRVLLAP
jgi:transposase